MKTEHLTTLAETKETAAAERMLTRDDCWLRVAATWTPPSRPRVSITATAPRAPAIAHDLR
jgi:hypothetical protein